MIATTRAESAVGPPEPRTNLHFGGREARSHAMFAEGPRDALVRPVAQRLRSRRNPRYDRLGGIEQRQVATDPERVLRDAVLPPGDRTNGSRHLELWRLADHRSPDGAVARTDAGGSQ